MKQLTPMRQKILTFVTEFTRQSGFPPTVREICEGVGLRSPSTVHAHLKILQEGGFLEKDGRKNRSLSVTGMDTSSFRSVPLLGTVTAGIPILAQEDRMGCVPYDGNASGELFALKVRGDSMIGASILDGDVVIVRQQSTALHGQIVVALLEEEATVKRLKLAADGVWLMPENPAYAPIDGRECSILGLVVGLYRSL